MSAKHPVIAVTGSSGAGTTTTSLAFRKIFAQLNLHAAEVEGDSFHRYTRPEMDMAIRKARDAGRHISYFGPEANDFGLLEQTFIEYGQSGKGKSRKYLHTYDEAVPWNQVPGTFTPWQPLPEPTDVLFYEGLHGGVVTPQHNVAQHVDLLVGVVPIVNLEWIQKLIRDTSERGHSREAVMDSVVRSMEDYINYITPQFSRTHLNFQRVPTVDTSNPFAAKGIPSLDESFVVIHFRNLEGIDFPWLLAMLQGSFISHINTLVVPGGKITDLALRMLHDMTGADSSVSKCYFTRAKSGVLMKSLTIAIRNREQRVIGLLCINMNLDVPFSQIMSTFVPPETPDVGSSVNFASSVEDLVTQTLEFTIEEVNADRNVSNNAKNRQIVLNLYEKGIFDIKDAINQVADRLNISKHTVYLYIRQFKSGDFQGQDK